MRDPGNAAAGKNAHAVAWLEHFVSFLGNRNQVAVVELDRDFQSGAPRRRLFGGLTATPPATDPSTAPTAAPRPWPTVLPAIPPTMAPAAGPMLLRVPSICT